MEAWQFALTMVAALLAGPAFLILGAWLLRRSGVPLPQTAPPSIGAVTPPLSHDELAELRGELSAVRAEWKAHQKQLDAYLDALEDVEESVERKRRRTAASRSKLEALEQRPEEQQAYDPRDREAARRRARALGYRI